MYVCMYVCMYVKILFQHNNRLGKGDGIYDILSNNDGEYTHAGISVGIYWLQPHCNLSESVD